MSGDGQIVNSHLVGDHVRPNVSRRALLASGAAAVLAAGLGVRAHAQRAAAPRERVLLRGGCVLTLDPRLGDFDRADVLIEGTTIAAVAPNLEITGDDVEVIDASRMIVMPGFVDTHRHMWQGALRNVSPDGLLSDYTRDITGAARSVFRPEDAYIGDLVSALGALNAGVTTVLDWSHIGNSPEHTDAAIAGLREAGIRAVYAYGSGTPGPSNRWPADIRRLRAETQMAGDMFTQMRTVFALQRMQALERQRLGDERAPALLGVRDVVEFATVQGAIANRLDDRIGTLTPGKQADVILLRTDAINVLPLNDAYGAVVLAMDTSNVDTVLVAGRVRKRGGVLVDVDLERIRRDAEAARDRIRAAVGWPASRV